MHPIEDLNALVRGEIGQCLSPSLVHDNRTDGSVEIAALRTFPTDAPRGVDPANEIDASVTLRRQRNRYLALAEFGFEFCHAATMAANLAPRPEAAEDGSSPSAASCAHNAAVTALISV